MSTDDVRRELSASDQDAQDDEQVSLSLSLSRARALTHTHSLSLSLPPSLSVSPSLSPSPLPSLSLPLYVFVCNPTHPFSRRPCRKLPLPQVARAPSPDPLHRLHSPPSRVPFALRLAPPSLPAILPRPPLPPTLRALAQAEQEMTYAHEEARRVKSAADGPGGEADR